MLHRSTDYTSCYNNFRWEIPENYNMGFDVCDRLADESPDSIAIIDIDESGQSHEISFSDLRRLSNQFANYLASTGIHTTEEQYAGRVAVLLPQRHETAITHIATWKLGCISIPLFTLFGEDALIHRLRDSGTTVVVTDAAGCQKLRALRDRLPDLQHVVSVDGPEDDAVHFNAVCAAHADQFTPVHTHADDPALLIYTSGTTGQPKGALHAHRVLLGHLPGVEIAFNFLPEAGDRLWTPADWAWIGGLLDVLMPGLHHGVPVVAHRFTKFDPVAAFELIAKHEIKNVFLPPTAMKIMRTVDRSGNVPLALRSVASGGETLGAELIEWSRKVLGAPVNEFYGQTECNMIVSSCSELEPATPGVMGRPVPGHRVEIIDENSGQVIEDGHEGAIAVLSPDPVMFLHYWNNPDATAAKFIKGPDGQWLLTGDRGQRTENGKIKYIGRDDDVISSAGYRIGPAEIEDCLLRHPAVRLAAAVAKPDELRGSVVVVYLELVEGQSPSSQLQTDIVDFVKTRLAAHEYPRAVRFVDTMPMTTTGKIIRAELRKLAEQDYLTERTNTESS